jgi:hypothetical protein
MTYGDNINLFVFVESGQLGTLSDTNLDGVEDGPSYVINGWADATWKHLDSNLIIMCQMVRCRLDI